MLRLTVAFTVASLVCSKHTITLRASLQQQQHTPVNAAITAALAYATNNNIIL
jgi:hypothetical protein